MSIVKHKDQRVGVFIDTQNLYHSARNIYNARVNFGAVLKEAVGKRGIETKTKPLQIFYGGAKKADWDVALAIDSIKMASKLDSVVIVSGDGDFIPLVEYLRSNQGCQ